MLLVLGLYLIIQLGLAHEMYGQRIHLVKPIVAIVPLKWLEFKHAAFAIVELNFVFFFVFWWEDRINYYYFWKAIDISYRRVCSIKQGLPSIPIEKVAMPKACFARRWVGLLPSLRTWDNSTLQKSRREDRAPYTIAATDAGGGAISFKALIKFSESFSRIMSWISIVAAQPYGQGGPIII